MEFTASLRGEGAVTLVAYEYPDPSRAVALARRAVSLRPDRWTRAALRFRTGPGRERASIHVYLPARKDAEIRMEAARLASAD